MIGFAAPSDRSSTSSVAKKGSGMMRKNFRPGIIAVLAVGLASGFHTGVTAQERTDNPYTSTQDVQTGEQLFGSQCSVCHGVGATGGEIGPDLSSGVFSNASTDAGLFGVISEGVPNTAMIGINATRTDQSVWQIVTYLRSLSGGQRVAVAGDASSGERLFRGQGNCTSCHVVEGVGGRHGPDLSTIGDRRSPDQLLSDLVDPDERVEPRWWRMRVTHVDGTRIGGLRMNEGTYSLRILDDDDNLWSLQKRDLRESERIETSSMPAYGGIMTEGQLEDLVAYVYGLTGEDP
jgi:cytochrome c oxidase cbb3-type subunit 3